MRPALATRGQRKLQLPKKPGVDTRASPGSPPRALLGGVVPRLGAAGWSPAPRRAHLPDGGTEAALQDALEGLQLLRGQLPAALQPLEELHGSGHVCGAGAGMDTQRDTETQSIERRSQRPSKDEHKTDPGKDSRRVAGSEGETAAGIPIRTQAGVCGGRPSPAGSPTDPPTPIDRPTGGAPPTSARALRGRGGNRGSGGQGPLARLPRSSPSGSTSAAMSAPPLLAARPPGPRRGGRACAGPRPRRRAPPAEAPPRVRSAPRSLLGPFHLLRRPQPPTSVLFAIPFQPLSAAPSMCLSSQPHLFLRYPFFPRSLDKRIKHLSPRRWTRWRAGHTASG